jgi:hypothetical protein
VNLLPTSQSAARRLVATVAIAYVAVASFPATYYALRAGLDISWVYGLNHFFNSRFKFGRDVNFTYGPLGFLLYPANLGHDVLLSILFRVAVAILFILSLGLLAPGRTFGLALFAAAYGVALGIGHTFDFHLEVVTALATIAAMERRSLPALLAIAALSGPLWLTKFSVGLGVATAVATAAVAWRVVWRGSLGASIAIIGVHAASLLCAGWMLLGSVPDLFKWARASLEMVGGYSVAMSFDPGWTDVRKGVAICAIYVAAAALLFVVRRRAALPLILLAGSLFLAFKAGFVREDAHVMSFFGFAAAALAIPLLTGASGKERIVAATAFFLAVALGVRGELKRGYLDGRTFTNVTTGKQGIVGLDLALHPHATELELDRTTVASMAHDRLPEEVLHVIGSGTVLVMPWELLYCLANDLDCVPMQTLQEYNAYTPYLDSIVAAQFDGRDAPDFVLVHTLQSTDERHVVLDIPRTWRVLMERYEPVRQPSPEIVLLRRRAFPVHTELVPLSTDRLRPGEWISVPAAAGHIYAEMHFDLSWSGRLFKLLHRIPPGYIEFRRAGGVTERRRLIFETSAGGILVQPFAAELKDLPALLEGSEGNRVVAVRIVGPAVRHYGQEVTLRWLAASVRASETRTGIREKPQPEGAASR